MVTRNKRSCGSFAAGIAVARVASPPSVNSMLDWPEQTHTSPIKTSSKASLFLPATVIVVAAVDVAAGKGCQVHPPLAVGIGRGFGGVIAHRHRDGFAHVRPTPHRNFGGLLQYHVTAENRREPDISRGW